MKKNVLKYSVFFIVPALLMGTIVVANASWKDSIKNNSATVSRNVYSIEFYEGNTKLETYAELEYNSSFERPFLGTGNYHWWGPTNSFSTGTAYTGYHTLNEFSSDIDSNNVLKLYAKEGAIYTVDVPNWLQNDGAVTFAWVWANNDPGSSHIVTFGANDTATFVVDYELNGFNLVRCAAGTTELDWSTSVVYNQTDNIPCTPGQFSYNSNNYNWHEH